MKNLRKTTTKKMLDWYIEIIQDWPKSKDHLYDFEAEYQDVFSDFLVNACSSFESRNFYEGFVDTLENYRNKLVLDIAQEQKLYDVLMSALDSRICDFLQQQTFEVAGDYNMIAVQLGGNTPTAGVRIYFELTNEGYLPRSLRCADEQIDAREMTTSDLLASLREHTKD